MVSAGARRWLVAATLAGAACGAPVWAQLPVEGPPKVPAVLTLVPGMPATIALGSGPYAAIMESDPRLASHTVYRPADLGKLGSHKLPIVAWGNGSCVNAGNRFRWFLSEVASYGFLTIAIGPVGPGSIEAGPSAPAPAPGSAAALALTQHTTHPAQLFDALNWAIAENARPASQYYQRLDTGKFAVMGQSCGGEQAIEASADPRVTTAVMWNSGIKPGASTTHGGKLLTKEALKAMHAPAAYISGDARDIAFDNANDDFDLLNDIPVLRAYENGVSHSGTYREANGGEFAGVAIAWLSWQLKGDQTAARMFVGSSCGLCVNPRWHVRKKKID